MARLIVEHDGLFRVFANIAISTNDGSIILSLIRSGTNTFGWQSDPSGTVVDAVQYSEEIPRTKKITIHTSGRVNYHGWPQRRKNFIPCLLDLTEPTPIIIYVIPTLASLDLAGDVRTTDQVVEIVDGVEEALALEFSVIPFDFPQLPREIMRIIIESRYALTCVAFPSASLQIQSGVPAEAFFWLRPTSFLSEQALPEDQCFIRFQQLMHANQIRSALTSSSVPEGIHDQIIGETVRDGRGIQGPNGEGVWEIVTRTPMRIRPSLIVQFSNPRYRAEVIDMKPTDTRLDKVRVRFKVFDEEERRWIKHSVAILDAFLDAEMY